MHDGSRVTSVFKLLGKHEQFYMLDNVQVSGTHSVKHNNKWIYVNQHPNATKLEKSFNEIYCLNTTSKTIKINNTVFGDWDDIHPEEISILKSINPNITQSNIHKFFESGYDKNTLIQCCDKTTKKMSDLKLGDKLLSNNIVTGLVITSCKEVPIYCTEQVISTHKKNRSSVIKHDELLYNCLTSSGKIHINNKIYYDYNNQIEQFFKNNPNRH